MNIAILGCGTVGTGLIESLKNTNINVTKIVDKRDIPEYRELLTSDINDILDDPSIDLVAELMGGEHPAYDFVKAALLSGKHAVTANKQMLSIHYKELTDLAKDKNLFFEFSATAGGGIPWLYNLKRIASFDEIEEVGGVMNGTTNYILDSMQRLGKSYDEALKEAQALGYAEADPTADVKGLDIRAKLAISANIAFNTVINPETIPTEGITEISDEDIKKAKAQGLVYRLVGKASRADGKVVCEIKPRLIETADPLYSLRGAENLFYIKGKNCGSLSFRGAGAGKYPTGANVAADIINIEEKLCLK